MAKMVSMALSVAEKTDAARPFTDGQSPEDMVDYPQGLTLFIGTDELAKMGLNTGKLDAGNKVQGTFAGLVTGVNAQRVNGVVKYRCTIQITDLGLEPQPEQDRGETIYGANQS